MRSMKQNNNDKKVRKDIKKNQAIKVILKIKVKRYLLPKLLLTLNRLKVCLQDKMNLKKVRNEKTQTYK